MSASNWFQMGLLALAGVCIYYGWQVPALNQGDASLGDAFQKLVDYGAALVLILSAGVWYMVGK